MATTGTPPASADPNNSGGTAYLATQSTFVAIAGLLVVIRIYVRSLVVRQFGLDDAAICLAMALSLVVCGMTSETVHYVGLYLGGHFTTKAQAIHYVVEALKWSSISAPIGIISGMFIRLSVCLFLLRIFWTKREWRLGLYAVMAFVIVSAIPTIVSLLAQCSPVEKLWDPRLPGKCWDPKVLIKLGYFHGVVSVLSDWILATLPIVFMWNIQMKISVKLGICVLMGLGYFTGVCAMVRTILFEDGTGDAEQGGSIASAVWAILEINVGIIAATIPTLKPLFNSSRPSIFRYLKSRKSSEKYRKSSEITPAKASSNPVRFNKLTLGTLPSAMPSTLSYYQGNGNGHDDGWRDLESQISNPSSEKTYVVDQGGETEMSSKLETAGDGELHSMGEDWFERR